MAYMGGSAFSMAQQIQAGHILVTERTFVRMQKHELDRLGLEMDRALRGLRGTLIDKNDIMAFQGKNRAISRLTSASSLMRAFRARRKI